MKYAKNIKDIEDAFDAIFEVFKDRPSCEAIQGSDYYYYPYEYYLDLDEEGNMLENGDGFGCDSITAEIAACPEVIEATDMYEWETTDCSEYCSMIYKIAYEWWERYKKARDGKKVCE